MPLLSEQRSTLTQTLDPDSLQGLAGHLQVVVSLGLREALEVHQTGVQLLVVVSELWRYNKIQPRLVHSYQGFFKLR